jgi:hypothetical protein
MSGFKVSTVALSKEVINKFRGPDSKQRIIQPESEPVMREIETISKESLDVSIKSVENRTSAYQDRLSDIDNRISQIEDESRERFLQQEKVLFATIQNQAGHLLENLSTLHQWIENQFSIVIEDERQARIEQFTGIESRIQVIENQVIKMRELGFSWIDAASKIIDFTKASYHHNFFAPGHINRLNQILDLSRNNIDQGAFEAALSLAQQGYLDVSQLRLELEYLETEWLLVQQAVLEGLRQLDASQESNRYVDAIDFEGKELEIILDVNAWTGGGLDTFRADLFEYYNYVIAGIPTVDTQGLERIADIDIPILKQRLNDLVVKAQTTALSAQVRINIADLVVQALECQGFSLKDSQYLDNNLTKDYRANLHGLDGSEVEIIVAPIKGNSLQNDLAIISHDIEQRSEHELHQRAKEISDSLIKKGLNVSPYKVRNPNEINNLIQSWSKEPLRTQIM